jgi:chromosome segregation ATPase
MSQPARLEERVSDLETEMAEVRFLATKAEREVSDVQTVLRGHTGTLNAIREDQVDQGKELAKVKVEVKSVRAEMHNGFIRIDEKFAKVDENFAWVDENFAKVDENFARVDENFAKVERKFELLHRGQDRITDLLTRHLGEWTDETRAGGTDE